MKTEEIQKRTKTSKGIVLYFKNDLCSPCLVLRPKVEQLIKTSFPKLEFVILDTIENPLLSQMFNVFSNPTILIFFNGNEYIRKNKNMSLVELKSKIERLYKMVY